MLNAARLLSFAEAGDEARSLDRLLRHLPRTARLPDGAWRLFRVRPANHPARSVVGAAHLVDRFLDLGPVAHVEAAIDPRAPSRLAVALGAPPFVGPSRARDMAINVALPFMHALAGLKRDGAAAARVLETYRSFPGLGDNEITREMKRLLAAHGHSTATKGARRHQELTHLYNVMTRPELARSEWPAMMRAVGAG